MGVSDQLIIDLAIEENFSPSREFLLHWEALATWQLDILKNHGLAPHHKLLDIGCGPLRLGLKAIPYLESGNYAGIDALDAYLRIGERLLREAHVDKAYTLRCDNQFDFNSLGIFFDYAIAQSVFTHLSMDETMMCIRKLARIMKPGGLLIFTYILSNKPVGKLYGGTYPMRVSAIPSNSFFELAATEIGAAFETIEHPHPTGQSVGILRFLDRR